MDLPRALTFTTDAHFRRWPSFKLMKGTMINGNKGWILSIGWLKFKLDIYNLESWNALCAQLNGSFKNS